MLPRDHLLRRVDRLLDLGELRATLTPHYSRSGRPSVDPELLIRMALIGRIYAITSERRLCSEILYREQIWESETCSGSVIVRWASFPAPRSF